MLAAAVLALATTCGPAAPASVPGVTTGAPTTARPAEATAAAPSAAATAAAAPSCAAPAPLTIAQTEGPYFKAGAPQRTALADASSPGTRVVLTGRVLTRSCAPVAGARLEFWQANAAGEYDNAGFAFRGHQLTDAQGRYRLETVVPGEYPGRTPHIHVKVIAGGRELVTQLYFPDKAQRNQADGIYRPGLTVTYASTGTPLDARFDFVIDAA